MNRLKVIVVLLVIGVLSLLALAAVSQPLTGIVTDERCGAKHTMDADAATCTRACIKEGSNYALVVGDKVYVLDVDKDSASVLDQYAGKKVTVTGEVRGKTVKVQSVTAAS